MTKPKRRKLKEKPATRATKSVDRISSLPDSLLCHILSFLPTRTAMSTSILSRRWRHVWEHLQVFDFRDSSVFKHDFPSNGDAYFIAFVNAVLALRRVRHIQKFCFSCEIPDKYVITTWLRAAIGPHLQKLLLDLSTSPSSDCFYLPHSIFTCTALVSLTLKGQIREICVEKLSSIHLPSLKSLKMESVNVNSIDKLLSGCPVLEKLRLVMFCLYNAPKICMPSSLKSLTFKVCTPGVIEDLEIDTPSLKYLDIDLGASCLQFSVSNLYNVVAAHVGFYYPEPTNEHVGVLPKLLRALRRTKFLELTRSATEVACLSKSHNPLTKC